MSKAQDILISLKEDVKEDLMSVFQEDLAKAFNKLIDGVHGNKDIINELHKIRRDVVTEVEDMLLEKGFDYERQGS